MKQLADKLENYTPLLKERWDEGWPAFQGYYELNNEKYSLGPPAGKYSGEFANIVLKEKYGGRSIKLDLFEHTGYQYNPVPEEVACMALKMLSEEKDAFEDIGDYTITRRYGVDYQSNLNQIYVEKEGGYVIYIGWRNGELVQNISDEGKNIDTVFGKHNIFDISGYYEARNFGFSWHKE